MNPAARKAWAATRVVVRPEQFVLAELAADAPPPPAGAGFSAVIREGGAVSVIMEESAWDGRAARAVHRSYRVVSLEADLAPDLAGYLAPAAARLADAGVPIVPVCGARHDHLLVRDRDITAAVRILEDLVRECRESP